MRKIIFIIGLLASINASAQFPSTDSIRHYIDKYIRTSAIDAFNNLRLNTALKGLANLTDSLQSQVTGGVRVVDTMYKYNDTTIAYKIKGSTYLLNMKSATGSSFAGVIRDGTLQGNGLSATPLRVDTTNIATIYAVSGLARGAISAGAGIAIDGSGVISSIVTQADGSETKVLPGQNVQSVTGLGTNASPYVINGKFFVDSTTRSNDSVFNWYGPTKFFRYKLPSATTPSLNDVATVGNSTTHTLIMPSLALNGDGVGSGGRIAVYNRPQTFFGILYGDSITANRNWLVPDKSGTLAVLSDIDTTNISNFYLKVRAKLSAGTGISYNNTTGIITNSAPDQTVALNAGTGIGVSGTYPNFTITNSSPGGSGTVTSVTSATADATVATTTTTPVITIVAAPKLTTARTIQGISFDGTANINPISGTGFVKATGTTLSYDNSTYLSSIDTGNISNFYLKVRGLHSASAPITYNTTTGAIGITQATTSTNGYLSSTDWNTFNGKLSTVDTGNIANFYLKVRSLLSAGTGISYNNTTGVISSTYSTPTLDAVIAAGNSLSTNRSIDVNSHSLSISGNGAGGATVTLGEYDFSGSHKTDLTLQATGINMGYTDPDAGKSKYISIGTSASGIQIADAVNNLGVQYLTDYSSAGLSNDRWLPDLGAVKKVVNDTATALRILIAGAGAYTFTSPLVNTSGTISINNAAADGSTKGAATFTANDFNASSGNISIDYTNGQAASASNKGFLTSSDWTTFNNKLSSVDTGNISNFYLKVRGLHSAGTGIGYNTTTGVISNTGVTSVNGNTGSVTVDTTFINNFYLKVRSLFSAGSGASYNSTTGVITATGAGVTSGNLTEATSSILTITGGTNAVLGSGTTIQVKQASGSQSGFLSSTDWSNLNGKQTALSGTGFVKISGTTISYDNSTYLTTSSASSTYQPLDADLTTIAGLTATTDNFMVGVSSAWASRTPSQVKTTLSLNNVENTALSTWAGTSNITTVGTIGTGTWNGGVIAGLYGGTGVANSGKTITLGGNLTTSGAFATTFTATATTSVTLPTSGTLATLAGTETFTNKTLTSPVINVTSDATGDVYYRSSGGAFTRLGIGSTNQVLTVSSGLPSWQNATGGGGGITYANLYSYLTDSIKLRDSIVANNGVIAVQTISGTDTSYVLRADSSVVRIPSTVFAQGDIVYYNGTGWDRLSAGTSGQYLKTQGTGANPTWSTVSGSGDASTNTSTSVDGEMVLFSSTTGKLLKRMTGTGIVKVTSGVAATASAGDFPTLNQSTTGSAATLTTTRAIYGNNFDGSAALTQIIASTYGGTGNGFTKFTGPTTSEKTFTLPNASATILTSNALVTAAQGGTNNGFFQVSGPASSTKTYTFPNASANVLTDNALVTSAQGGTANGFFTVSGPATTAKTFTFPNASATVLTDNAVVTGAQGGTGVSNSGKTITLGGNLTTSGAFATTFTATATTSVTLPTTGTLATLAGSETLTNKSVNGVTLSTASGATTFLNGSGSYAAPFTLTTSGTSGAATFTSGTLNIPQYSAGGGGDASTNTSTSVDGEVVLFSGTAGKTLKRATGTGLAKLTSGVLSTATSGTDYAPGTSALSTGILKSTTTTGALTIAIASDFPTLNQNTTGSAATITTARAIYGNNFDGSAALTQIIASTYGGTGNGFTKFSGPTTSEKTFTLPNTSATILTDNAAVTVAQGGTGLGSGTSGGIPYFSSTSAMTSSALLASNGIMLGGGSGAAPKTASGLTTDGTSKITLGVAGTSVGSVGFNNATSGSITLSPTTGALGTVTITMPATTGTMTVLGNSTSGSGNIALTTSPVFTTPNIGSATGSVSGNAGTATALQTARTINGTSFDGTANITVTAAAGTLTGSTLASGVTASSLTSVGTITSGTWNGSTIDIAHGGTNSTTTLTNGKVMVSSSGAIVESSITTTQLATLATTTAGSYQPTTISASNVAGTPTHAVGYYTRVGNIITFSGDVNVSATTGATQSTIDVSLPVNSSYAGGEVWGTINSNGGNITTYVAGATAANNVSTGNVVARLTFTNSTTAGVDLRYTLSYLVH